METKIGLEELEVLRELESIGVFLEQAEREEFVSFVCGPKAGSYQDITEDDFEAAFYRAKERLQKRGEALLLNLITQ